MLKAWKYNDLFLIGGCIYYLIEVLARGHSHWTMFILGGLCFVLLGVLNEVFPWEMPLLLQMAIGCVIITILEFITGCIVNLWLGWNVWDYSDIPFNILGQVCLKNSVYWFGLSAVGIVLDDYIRYWSFGEEKPRYKLI